MVYFISLGLGIYFRSSHILSKSSKNWFENRTFRGTKRREFLELSPFLLWYIQPVFRFSGSLGMAVILFSKLNH